MESKKIDVLFKVAKRISQWGTDAIDDSVIESLGGDIAFALFVYFRRVKMCSVEQPVSLERFVSENSNTGLIGYQTGHTDVNGVWEMLPGFLKAVEIIEKKGANGFLAVRDSIKEEIAITFLAAFFQRKAESLGLSFEELKYDVEMKMFLILNGIMENE